jgi:hypothetical protein
MCSNNADHSCQSFPRCRFPDIVTSRSIQSTKVMYAFALCPSCSLTPVLETNYEGHTHYRTLQYFFLVSAARSLHGLSRYSPPQHGCSSRGRVECIVILEVRETGTQPAATLAVWCTIRARSLCC